jgi:hypothetical protein
MTSRPMLHSVKHPKHRTKLTILGIKSEAFNLIGNLCCAHSLQSPPHPPQGTSRAMPDVQPACMLAVQLQWEPQWAVEGFTYC